MTDKKIKPKRTNIAIPMEIHSKVKAMSYIYQISVYQTVEKLLSLGIKSERKKIIKFLEKSMDKLK